MDSNPPRPARPQRRRLAIWEICVLVAGIAVGIWLLAVEPDSREISPYGLLIGVLGGASVVGPPLLLWERRRRKGRWGPGELLWFSTGISAWLLWPPVVAARLRGVGGGPGGRGTMGAQCFAYGTPLMAIYVGSALLFGGWIRRKGRSRRRRLSWRERFGLALGIAWAATGGYVLYLVYADK